MKNNRRNFLKITGLTGLSLAGGSLLKALGAETETVTNSEFKSLPGQSGGKRNQRFNMSGYAAPNLETVRIGFIGLGNRGPGHVSSMSLIEGVEIKALCDIVTEEAEKTRKAIESRGFKPDLYSGDAEAWKKLCDRPDIDLVYICTPWDMHTPMAVYAMEHGKHVAIEVPAAEH
jgi:hypothetical protein